MDAAAHSSLRLCDMRRLALVFQIGMIDDKTVAAAPLGLIEGQVRFSVEFVEGYAVRGDSGRAPGCR